MINTAAALTQEVVKQSFAFLCLFCSKSKQRCNSFFERFLRSFSNFYWAFVFIGHLEDLVYLFAQGRMGVWGDDVFLFESVLFAVD